MMRSLLADRFKLAVHTETRQVPVLAFVLLKPGKTGPQLRQHPDDATPCPTNLPPSYDDETVAGGFPVLCNGLLGGPPGVPGRLHFGARNVTIAFMADSLSRYAGFDRPMLDRTGLRGTFDFILEWTPEPNSPISLGADFQPDPSGPTFEEALREQLGLKLESQKGPVEVIVVDHAEHPSEN